MIAAETAPGHSEILRIVAPNPGPMTLAGTNTYIVGSDPAYVVDPGPADGGHIAAVRAEAERRGGLGGVLLTHAHSDHGDGVEALGGELLWGEPGQGDETSALAAAVRAGGEGGPGGADAAPEGRSGLDSEGRSGAGPGANASAGESLAAAPPPGAGQRAAIHIGPITVVATPGHAADHAGFLLGRACLCGDLILGEGSSIVPPAAGGGSLSDYMTSLELLAGLDLDLLCPGHGAWITDPAATIDEYRRHRLDRERRLLAALEAGERSRERLLEAAWGDVPELLRPAAALAMQAHLEKLAEEGRRFEPLGA